ncbi:hypothetical protein [Neobacillus sp. D3-1R]|uniref:hypothetical protein n=1 Tax=Neobacillus sp. D3-1R TaxID=3445778 RepID=UPI003F9ECA28
MQELKDYLASQAVVGPILKQLVEQPVIGVITLIILLLLVVNSAIKRVLDVNLLRIVVLYFQGKDKEERYKKAREAFYKHSTEKKFVKWQHQILKKIYADLPLVHLFHDTHLVIVHKAANKILYPFKENMKEFGELLDLNVPDLKLDRRQKHYFKIMRGTIRRPNLVGFELDEYVLNDKNEITGFKANVCQYKHTVLTSHILEYELFKTYKKTKMKLTHLSKDEIVKKLPYRNQIHKGQTNNDLIIKGHNRHSLLSVQMMVVGFHEKYNQYCTLIFKRSKEVAIKPNYWHIIPAGGFEIFEKEGTVNKYIIKQNFDVELALFRELIEEVFNGKDYEANETGEVNEIIHRHPDIVDLEAMLQNGEAKLEFLGNVTDLLSLRPELSFLLVVDNPAFFKKNFKINFEGIDLQVVPVNDLQNLLEDELLYPSSAGLLALAKESELMKERNLLQSL